MMKPFIQEHEFQDLQFPTTVKKSNNNKWQDPPQKNNIKELPKEQTANIKDPKTGKPTPQLIIKPSDDFLLSEKNSQAWILLPPSIKRVAISLLLKMNNTICHNEQNINIPQNVSPKFKTIPP